MATYVFYPYREGSTYVASDGAVGNAISEDTYANVRGGAGNTLLTTGVQADLLAGVTSNKWQSMRRGVAGFNTASLIDGITILSATLSAYLADKIDNFSQSIGITGFTPADPINLAATDFANSHFASVDFATRKTIASQSTGGYIDWALNANGIANIDDAGWSFFAFRFSSDIDNAAPTWANGVFARAAYVSSLTSGTTQDPKLTVVTTDPPTVTDSAATSVSQSQATLHGNVTASGGETVTDRGFYISPSTHAEETGTRIPVGTGTGAYSQVLSSLDPGRTYYFVAYAISLAGTSYSGELSFTTLQAPPTVETNNMSDVSPTTATGNGRVLSDGGDTLIEMGVVVDTAPNPDTSDTKFTVTPEVDYFSVSITGLANNTEYHMRAFARNAQGTTYGTDVSFTTKETQDTLVFNSLGLNNDKIIATVIIPDTPPERTLTDTPVPRADGKRRSGDYLPDKIIPVKLTVWDDTRDLLLTALDTIKKYCYQAEKFLDHTTNGVVRRHTATLQSARFTERIGLVQARCDIDMQFICTDPPVGYAIEYINNYYAAQTSLSNVKTVNNPGSYKTKPIFELQFSAQSGVTEIEISNDTNDKAITIPITLGATDLIVIDCENYKVTQNGVDIDFSGRFPEIEIDDNQITLTITGTSATYTYNIKYHKTFL